MAPRSPTLEGFRAILWRPSLGLAEVAWRWSFGAAGAALVTFAFFEYLDTLPVTRGDLILLRTRHPALISQAIQHIFKGSGFRLVGAIIVLAVASAIAWIVIAALGRAATIKALLGYFREYEPLPSSDESVSSSGQCEPERWHLRSLLGLNFMRVSMTLAATVGCFAALLAGGAVTSDTEPSPGSAFLVTVCVVMLVWLAWSVVNWFLSVASVFVVAEGRDALGAMTAAVDLCRSRPGAIFAAGTWFGLAHIVAFIVATTVVAFPMGLATVLPAGVTLGGVLLVTLLYFAVADFLYVGRLAAYVAILKLPQPVVATKHAVRQQPVLDTRSSSVDPDELILGDLPAPG